MTTPITLEEILRDSAARIVSSPNCGRSSIQAMRNRSVQYFAFPGFKFADLRKEAAGLYETYADIGLD